MKKLALSILVIAIFLAYSYHQRHDDGASVQVSQHRTASSTTAQPAQSNQQATTAPSTASSGRYKNGTYTGSVTDAFYGNVQVQAAVNNGKLANVQFLQYPSDRQTSRDINSQAMPMLITEAIQAQSGRVDTITGATDTSLAFIESLTAALSHAN
jgi:uncharacterized protein with FMN-binding domain